MQVSVDKIGPCEAKVTFSVPRADFDREYKASLRASGKNVRMKGFRPGKVPVKILEKEYGAKVLQHTVDQFMGKAFDQAVKENDFQPVGHARVDASEINLNDGVDLEHDFSISLQPEIELGEYTGLEVTSEFEPVTDEEIDAAITDLRMQQSSPGPVDEEGIPEDGQAICKIKWECEGEILLDRKGLRMAPLASPPGVDPDKFKEALVGAQAGHEFELEMTVPSDFDQEQHRGKQATCIITVTEGFKLSPPPDEEIWKLFEVESQEDFDRIARERLTEAKQSQENSRQETVLLESLLEAHDFELPRLMVESQLESRRAHMRQQLAQDGVPEEGMDAALAEKEPEIEADTNKGVRALFLVNAIAEKEDLKVGESEMIEELQAIAQRHGTKYEDVVEHHREKGLFQQLQIELLERKVRGFLRENAKSTEP